MNLHSSHIRSNLADYLYSTNANNGRASSLVEVEGTRMFTLYVTAILLMTLLVVGTNFQKGFKVVSKILLYVYALSTMKLTVKYVFVAHAFSYPAFLTVLHLACSALLGFVIMSRRALRHANKVPIEIPTMSELALGIAPIGLAFGVSLALNNSALVLCSASFTEIVGATTPLVTVGLVILMGLPFDFRLVLPVSIVVGGCVMSVSGNLNFSMLGATYCFLANVARSARTTLQQKLMTGETKDKFDPPALLAWTCGASAVIMFIMSIGAEGMAPFHGFLASENKVGLVFAIFTSCVNACILNLAVLFVTRDLGAVGQQIVAQLKSIATVLGGIALLGESFTRGEVAGFGCVLIGTSLFSYLQDTNKKKEVERSDDIEETKAIRKSAPATDYLKGAESDSGASTSASSTTASSKQMSGR